MTAFAIAPLVIFYLTEPNLESSQLSEQFESSNSKFPIVTITVIYALTFLTMLAFYMIPVQLPFYLQRLGQTSGTQSGFAIAACTLASAIASMRYKSIKNSFSFQGILVGAYALIGLGYFAVSRSQNYALVVISLIVADIGLGLVMPNMNVWTNAVAPAQFRGRALGGVTSAMFLGQFFSPIVAQPIANTIGLGETYGLVGKALWGLMALIVILSMRNGTALKTKKG